MKTKRTIEIRQIAMDKIKNKCDSIAVEDLFRSIPSHLSSRFETNPDKELNLLGVFVLGELVGIIYYWFEPSSGTGYIDRLTVTSDLHRLGYGCAALTKAIEQLCKIPGCKRIRTTFIPSNPIIETLYHTIGFRKTGEIVGEDVVTIMDVSP